MSDAIAIEARGLSVDVGGRRVLDGVSLSARTGEFVCLCGPNGGGKTTFLKATLGLLPPAAGTLRVLGTSPEEARRSVGYLPQRKSFAPGFPATVVELLSAVRRGGWPVRVHRDEREAARAALARVGGEALLDRPLAGLSGGETQRAFLARALVGEPRLLLLDEPTAGVDAAGRAEFLEVLAEVAARDDVTAVLVTHNQGAVRRLADRVAYLDGTLRSFGPPDEVLTGGADERRAFGGLDHADSGVVAVCEEE
ncbi:MAG TPA: metal ABC transporter ATP-binding protein [Vicinamibacteria bacterium]|nr:metal ABC transporter ATP-binding protein [Vicinamibacteria bacterium]